MNQKRIERLVLSAMFCALVFAATWISVPAPAVGNINLGDAMLLLCAWLLGGPYSVIAAAAGSALTDLMGAYAIYAPGTFVIKALMVTVAILLLKIGRRLRLPQIPALLLSGIGAELVMIGGYYLYEATFLSLGFAGAAVNIPFNAIQGGICLALAVLCRMILKHTGFHLSNQSDLY